MGTEVRFVGNDTLAIPITEQVAALFPDRPNGYDLFEAAAIAFGGAGAIYDPTADGDTQVDLNPSTGEPCSRQGVYIGFCLRNDQYVPRSTRPSGRMDSQLPGASFSASRSAQRVSGTQ